MDGLLPGTQGCTNALLYSRKGAQFVIDNLMPIRSPIDDWLHLNAEDSYCLHKRIFCQHDSVEKMTLKSLFNPMYRKYERLINAHFICVIGISTFFFSVDPDAQSKYSISNLD